MREQSEADEKGRGLGKHAQAFSIGPHSHAGETRTFRLRFSWPGPVT